MTSEFQGVQFNEAHIGRIAADAWNMARNQEPTDQAQQNLEDAAASSWPMDRKIQFMLHVAPLWMPPHAEETSWWNNDHESAAALLEQFPELTAHLAIVSKEQTAAHKALETMEEMEEMEEMTQLPYGSTKWQIGWDQLRRTLTAMTTPGDRQ